MVTTNRSVLLYNRRIQLNLKGKIPTAFETDRLLVRRYRQSDADHLFQAAQSSIAEVFPFLPWCHPEYQLSESINWLKDVEPAWRKGDAYNFAIFSQGQSELLGGCGINRIDEHPIGNLGYWVKSGNVSKGIATEATVALARFGIEQIGLKRIEIVMSVENTPSRRVAEKSGAVYEGKLRNRLTLHGKAHDAYIYSITPEDLDTQQ